VSALRHVGIDPDDRLRKHELTEMPYCASTIISMDFIRVGHMSVLEIDSYMAIKMLSWLILHTTNRGYKGYKTAYLETVIVKIGVQSIPCKKIRPRPT
jgi:hypothetical protein